MNAESLRSSIVTFIENAVDDGAAGPVDLFGCDAVSSQYPFEPWRNLLTDADHVMILKLSVEQRRHFLHPTRLDS